MIDGNNLHQYLFLSRYKTVDDFKIEDIGSIKKIDDDLINPMLMTFESSKFLGNFL